MSKETIQIREISDIMDDFLFPWLDLYETAFPSHEKMLVSSLLKILKNKSQGEDGNMFFLAATDENGKFIGLSLFEVSKECPAAFLWYLAVTPEYRNKGIGAVLYNSVIERLQPYKLKAAIFEVEIPSECKTEEKSQLALRRIQFYKRQGALLMGGIHYLQSVGSHEPLTPMYIMVHPFEKCSPGEAFNLAHCIFGQNLTQTGVITLE